MDNERMVPIFDDYRDPRDYAFEDEEINSEFIDDDRILMDNEQNRIEKEIEKFNKISEKINRDFNRMQVSLSLNYNLDISEEIKNVSDELQNLVELSDEISLDIDRLRMFNKDASFSMTISEIKEKVKKLKERLKSLKKIQVEKYNAKVDYINNEINKLHQLTDVKPEIAELINKLIKLTRCDVSVRDWRAINYLNSIDYNKIETTLKLINEINKKLDVVEENTEKEDLAIDMFSIENKLTKIDENIKNYLLSEKDVDELKETLVNIGSFINDFRVKLENNRDKLSEDEYNDYLDRINDSEADLADLNTILINNINYDSIYEELLNRTNDISSDVDKLFDDVDAFFGLVYAGGKEVFETRFSTLENKINELEKDIEDRYNDKKLDDNQYKNLKDKIQKVKDNLDKTNNKLMDPKMIKDADIYAVLNGEIDGVGEALSRLEEQIEKLDKPIKDKKIRKQIDSIIKKIEDDVKKIEKMLEKYKDEEPEKYNSTRERLDEKKKKLDEISKKYRGKCPLMVKAVKSAKNFFKKYKKQVLIIAGLASFALVAHHVLIPAIMHGNIMIGFTTPALRGFSKFINSVLGSIIGATKTSDGLWFLSSGVRINPSIASTSLLKGLAVSGVSSAALVTPIIVAIKKLSEKMKTVDLKKKLSEGKEAINFEKDKLSKKIKKSKDKYSEKRKNDKADKMTSDYFAKLYHQLKKSSKSVDEFCKDNNLSEDEKMILNIYSNKHQQFMKEFNDDILKKSRRSS